MKLSLVFPVYNEGDTITEVLEDFAGYCVSHHIDHEIIVVNDGSRDNTNQKVTDFAARHSTVRLIEHRENQGYGAALRSGFSTAMGDFIFFTDSDGQFRSEDLERTLPLVNEGTIILGYRQPRTDPAVRRLNAWLWSRMVQLTLGIHTRDLNCAWKLLPQSLLHDVTLVSTGAFISAELLFYARKKGLVFHEIPVQHFPRTSGASTGAHLPVIFRSFRELLSFLKRTSSTQT